MARDTHIVVTFSEFLKPVVSNSITVKQIENSMGKTTDHEISGSITFNKKDSILTFSPHKKLPGNSIIRVFIDKDKIVNFANKFMKKNICWKFKTLISGRDANLIIRKSTQTTLKIPAGQFPSDGTVDSNEGIPRKI